MSLVSATLVVSCHALSAAPTWAQVFRRRTNDAPLNTKNPDPSALSYPTNGDYFRAELESVASTKGEA